MDRISYFKEAIKANMHLKKYWMISAFSVIVESLDDYKKNPYPYRIVQNMSGVYYVHPETMELVKITDAKAGEPLFTPLLAIEYKKGELKNIHTDIRTTIGNVIANDILINKCLDGKIPFITGKLSLDTIVKFVESNLKDGFSTDPGANYKDTDVPIDLWLRVPDAVTYLEGLSKLLVPSWSLKLMTAPPGINEFKEKLIKEHEHELDNPAVLDKINKALIDYDSEYLKGDRAAEGFGYTGKLRKEVRKKLYMMSGTEKSFDGSGKISLISRSLEEEWDPKDLPLLINSLRMGSYNRGAATPLGGEIFKWLTRISSAIKLDTNDCGSKLGYPKTVTKNHVGFTIIDNSKLIKLDKDNINNYIGKVYEFRSPMYCKTPNNNYCSVCCGDRLSLHVDGLGMATSELGSIILYIYMKKMHDAALDTAVYDINTALS